MLIFDFIMDILEDLAKAAMLALIYATIALILAGLTSAYSAIIPILNSLPNIECGYFSMEIDINGISSLVSQQIGWHYNKFFDLDFPYLRTNIKFVKMENDLDMSLKMGLLDNYNTFDYSNPQLTESEDLGIALASDPFEHPDFFPDKGLTSTEFGFEVEYTGSVMPDKVKLLMNAPNTDDKDFDKKLKTDGDLQQLLEEGRIIYYLDEDIFLDEVGQWEYNVEAYDENGFVIDRLADQPIDGPEIIGSLESFNTMFSYFSIGAGLVPMTTMAASSFLQKCPPYGPYADIINTLATLVAGSFLLLYPYYQIKDKNNDQLIRYFPFDVECGALKLAAIIYSIEMLVDNILAVYIVCTLDPTAVKAIITQVKYIIELILLFLIPEIGLETIIIISAENLALLSAAIGAWKACLDNQGFGVVGLFAYAIVHIASIIIYSSEFLGVMIP